MRFIELRFVSFPQHGYGNWEKYPEYKDYIVNAENICFVERNNNSKIWKSCKSKIKVNDDWFNCTQTYEEIKDLLGLSVSSVKETKTSAL